jgi:hypothetical protein
MHLRLVLAALVIAAPVMFVPTIRPAQSLGICLLVCIDPCDLVFHEDGSCSCKCPRTDLTQSQQDAVSEIVTNQPTVETLTIGKDPKTGNFIYVPKGPQQRETVQEKLRRVLGR